MKYRDGIIGIARITSTLLCRVVESFGQEEIVGRGVVIGFLVV